MTSCWTVANLNGKFWVQEYYVTHAHLHFQNISLIQWVRDVVSCHASYEPMLKVGVKDIISFDSLSRK